MTKQVEMWSREFGKKYTDRNSMSLNEIDTLLQSRLGISRSNQIDEFLSNLKLNNILEIGSNVGNQLLFLHKKGFEKLYGIELNRYAIDKSKERTKEKPIDIIQGSAFNIPFKDSYFDLVFTSEVLIHISPKDINSVLDEIYRCTKKYIWGFEFYSEDYIEVKYRGYNKLLWKTDFADLYLKRFSDLKLIRETKYPHLKDSKLIDYGFLLKKAS